MLRDAVFDVDRGEFAGVTPWEDDGWRSEFVGWVDERLAERDLAVVGRASTRLRPWSIVLGIPTTDGSRVWAKANPAASAFEGSLVAALAAWTPDGVVSPIDVDATRGWWIAPDGGPTLARPDPDDPPGAFRLASIRRFAELQRRLVGHVSEMIALGVPDRRPEALPAVLDELLDRHPIPDVVSRRDEIVALCAELAEAPHPASLDHGDLHDHQIFAGAGGDRFFDWGDASVGHPFTVLHVPLELADENYGPTARAHGALLEAYLSGWGDGDAAAARRLVSVADRLAGIGRAAVWNGLFPGNESDPSTAEIIRSSLIRLIAPLRPL